MDDEFGVKRVTCAIIRPGSELMKGQCGPVDTIMLDKPRTQYSVIQEEIRRVFPKDFEFTSLAVPSLLLAVEVLAIDLEREASADRVNEVLSKTQRVILVEGYDGLGSTDAIFEYFRRAVRPSADIYELCVWYEHVEVTNHRIKLVQAFDPHSIQIPEVIDAIRALKSRENMQQSINRTNKALKILNPGVYP